MCRRKEGGSQMNYKRGSIWTTSDRNLICNTGSLAAYLVSSATILKLFFSAFQLYHMHSPLSQNLSPGCSPFLERLSPLSFLLPRLPQNIEYVSLCYAVGSYLTDLCSNVSDRASLVAQTIKKSVSLRQPFMTCFVSTE